MSLLCKLDSQGIASRSLLNIYPILLPEEVRSLVRGPITEKLKAPFIGAREHHGSKRAKEFVDIYQGLLQKEFTRGEKLLEIGLGPGFIANEFKHRHLCVFAVDIGNYNIAEPRVPLVFYNNRLPFAGSIFDYISATSVLHHIPTQLHDGFFEEFRRVLKPEGFVLIQEDLRGRNRVEQAAIRAFDRAVSGPEANAHRFDSAWIDFFSSNGFTTSAQTTRSYGVNFLTLNKEFYLLKQNN